MAPAAATAIVLRVVDAEVIELCAGCLAGIAASEGSDEDLALAATALATDLGATHRAAAAPLLEAASREAVMLLDASDLDGHAFATALVRIAQLRLRVGEKLPRGPRPAVAAG